MTVQSTSLEALTGICNDDLGLSQRQLIVLSGLMYLKEANNLMIARHLRLPINCVTGRIFELREKGLVAEAGKRECPFTKRMTLFWHPRQPIKPKKPVREVQGVLCL